MTSGTGRDGRGVWQRTIDQAELDARDATLRAQGLSYRQIAAQMDVAASAAHRMVQRAIAAVPVEAVSELRKLEVERLDIAHAAAMEQLTAPHPYISNGHRFDDVQDPGPIFQAITAIVRISESRRKLLGLDAPAQVNVRVSDEMVEEIERLATELGIGDPDSPNDKKQLPPGASGGQL